MSYAKKIGSASLIQGTSFSVSVGKSTKTIWEDNETGIFEVTDPTNQKVLTGVLEKSVDKLSFTALIGEADCTSWDGNYRLLGYQKDSNNDKIKAPILDYDLDYSSTKADDE